MAGAGRNTEVLEQRVPWVSFSLVCLCVVGFGYAKIQAVEIEAVVESELKVAANHFRAHPYLVMPSLLEARIELKTARQLRQEYEARERRLGSTPRQPYVR
jgi:hypothetical protein